MIDKEAHLRTRCEDLRAEKHKRMKELLRLKTEDQELCDRLYTETYYIPSDSVPSEQQLDSLTFHVEQMKELEVFTPIGLLAL